MLAAIVDLPALVREFARTHLGFHLRRGLAGGVAGAIAATPAALGRPEAAAMLVTWTGAGALAGMILAATRRHEARVTVAALIGAVLSWKLSWNGLPATPVEAARQVGLVVLGLALGLVLGPWLFDRDYCSRLDRIVPRDDYLGRDMRA